MPQPYVMEEHLGTQLTNHQRELDRRILPGDLGEARTLEGNNEAEINMYKVNEFITAIDAYVEDIPSAISVENEITLI